MDRVTYETASRTPDRPRRQSAERELARYLLVDWYALRGPYGLNVRVSGPRAYEGCDGGAGACKGDIDGGAEYARRGTTMFVPGALNIRMPSTLYGA